MATFFKTSVASRQQPTEEQKKKLLGLLPTGAPPKRAFDAPNDPAGGAGVKYGAQTWDGKEKVDPRTGIRAGPTMQTAALPDPIQPPTAGPSLPAQPVSTATVGTGPAAPQIVPQPEVTQPVKPFTSQPGNGPTVVPDSPAPGPAPVKAGPPITSQSPYPAAPAAPAPAAPAPYKPSPQAPARPPSQTGQRVDDLWNYGQQAMANPSRYDSELMKANAKVIEDAIARMRSTGQRNLGEHFASRGLTGSSLEGFGMADLEGELGRYAQESTTGLMTDAARTYSQDRGQAFGMGSSAAGLGEQSEGRAGDEAYRGWKGEQEVYDRGRTQDQNELSLLSSIADRFGPDALRELGYA